MGSRQRRDPVEHLKRGKGAPTPSPTQPLAPDDAQPSQPGSIYVAIANSFAAGASTHPAIPGPVLDLHFAVPGGKATLRVPVGAWPSIAETVDGLVAKIPELVEQQQAQQRAAASGIVIPGAGANIAAEAAVHQKIKEGPKT